LRAGGCVTFKASEDYIGGGGSEEDDNESERMDRSQPGRMPAPLMNSTQLLFVPDLSVSGTYRVGGISGVTRSLGASTSLIPGLSGLPSLSVHRLSVAACLILATDGLWDTYGCSPDDLTHFFSGTPNREFAKLLTARAVRNGSSDNVTTLILWLGGCGTESEPMEVDLRSPTAYPTGTRYASVPSLGDSRLRGPLAMGALGENEFTLPCYVEPQERVLTRSHSSEDLADVDRIRASSPMRVLP
uniref:PPM-type phosphatase domain-containing protein n=1 Tax=Hydatigena taeniaeformis TaxID=6205 RepID=A0A0R3WS34_HYDTA